MGCNSFCGSGPGGLETRRGRFDPFPPDAPWRPSRGARTDASRACRASSPTSRSSRSACSETAAGESAGSAKRRGRPRGGRATGSRSSIRGAGLPSHSTISARRLDLLLRQVAEEGEGDVERRRRHRAQSRVVERPAAPGPIPDRTGAGRSSATNSRARGLFSRSFAMPPTLRGAQRTRQRPIVKRACRLRYRGGSPPPSRIRSRCIPTRAERSRMSARPPGITGSRAIAVPSARRALKQT